MKTGDKVRFLNAVGGGIVKRFHGKDIVYVEEPDGFETPVLIRECIIIEEGKEQVRSSSGAAAEKVKTEIPEIEEKIAKKQEKEYIAEEVAGGDILNVYLAFLPVNIKELGKTDFEAYLVNNSNYYLFFNYMNRENKAWTIRCSETVEPNTRLFIEEFSKLELNDLEHICIQFVAYKKDKPFLLKNPQSVEIRIDGVKFYKLHSFRENEFFEDEALIYPVVVKDIPSREMLVSATELQEAMYQKIRVDSSGKNEGKQKQAQPSGIIEVDLHIHELLDTTAGMNNTDILNVQLEKFHRVIEENKTKKGQKIVFIHGKGEGVLRNALLKELRTRYKNYPYQDASFKEYGFGATMVVIR